MTLLELVDPILERVCLLNRAGEYARSGVATPLDYHRVRTELIELLAQVEKRSDADRDLAAEYRAIKENLVVFVDNIISRSDLPFAEQWHDNRLAYEILDSEIRNGEDRFFEAVDAALESRAPHVADRLAFYYICLGLGFAERGPLPPDDRQTKLDTLAARLRDRMTFDLGGKICPDAYEHVDDRNLTATIRTPLRWTVVAALIAMLVVTVAMWGLVQWRYSALGMELDRIQQAIEIGNEQLAKQVDDLDSGTLDGDGRAAR